MENRGGGGLVVREVARQRSVALEAAVGVIEDTGRVVGTKPGERKALRGGEASGDVLEVVTGFVGEKTSDVEAAGERRFDGGEEFGELVERVSCEDVDGVEEEVAVLVGSVEARGFEEDGTGCVLDERACGGWERSPLRCARLGGTGVGHAKADDCRGSGWRQWRHGWGEAGGLAAPYT